MSQISDLYAQFWYWHRPEEHFSLCALALLNRLGQGAERMNTISFDYSLGNKLLRRPEVLHLMQTLRVNITFRFSYIITAILDDQLYDTLRQFPQIAVDSLDTGMTLSLSAQQLDRLLILLGESVHSFLKLFLKKGRLSLKQLNRSYFHQIFLILKRWKLENPSKVAKYSHSRNSSVKKVFKDKQIAKFFDSESAELIKALMSMTRSEKK